MQTSFLFYQDLMDFTIYQRTHYSNVYIITKSRNLTQYMDPDFFLKIINSPIADPDLLFMFPWVLEIEPLFKLNYTLEYKKHWKNG